MLDKLSLPRPNLFVSGSDSSRKCLKKKIEGRFFFILQKKKKKEKTTHLLLLETGNSRRERMERGTAAIILRSFNLQNPLSAATNKGQF